MLTAWLRYWWMGLLAVSHTQHCRRLSWGCVKIRRVTVPVSYLVVCQGHLQLFMHAGVTLDKVVYLDIEIERLRDLSINKCKIFTETYLYRNMHVIPGNALHLLQNSFPNHICKPAPSHHAIALPAGVCSHTLHVCAHMLSACAHMLSACAQVLCSHPAYLCSHSTRITPACSTHC